MDLSACSRVVIFGGSFDPPHVAHVALPLLVAEALDADGLIYIPAGRAPHKTDAVQTAPQHRLAMLRLAVAHVPRAVVLTDEMDRVEATGKPSYTVETLEVLRQRLGVRGDRVEMRLLIGADMARIFHQWRSPLRIAQLAEPVVMVRPPDTEETLLAALPAGERETWRGRLLPLPAMGVSSSEIRRRVSLGQGITGLVPPLVEDYIRRHGLYRSGE